MTGDGENPLNLHRTGANTRMYQISAETPGNNENTPISNSTVTRGRDLLAFSLIEFVPKASLAAGFSIQKRGKLHVSPAGQQAPGYPRTLLFILERWRSPVWGKTHFLPRFILTREKNAFGPGRLGPQTSLALRTPWAARHPPEQTARECPLELHGSASPEAAQPCTHVGGMYGGK